MKTSKPGGFDYEMFDKYRAHLDAGEEKQAKRLRDRLVEDNMRLVHKLVGKLHRRAHMASELEDLIQAGAIGVMKALPKYVPGKGAFATYAAHWVRDEVQNCMLHQMRLYRPRGSGLAYSTFRKIEAFEALENRMPTAEELGVKPEVLEAWRMSPTFVDIDQGDGEKNEGSSYHARSMQRETAIDADQEERLVIERQRIRVLGAIARLKEAERRIIVAIFFQDKNYDDLAKKEDLSDETIRKLKISAFEKLKKLLADEE